MDKPKILTYHKELPQTDYRTKWKLGLLTAEMVTRFRMAAEEMITPPEKSTGAAVPVIHKPRVEQKRASSRSNKMDHTFTSTLLSGKEVLETIGSASIGMNEPLTTEEQAERDELEEKRIAKPFPRAVALLRTRGTPQFAIWQARVEAGVRKI